MNKRQFAILENALHPYLAGVRPVYKRSITVRETILIALNILCNDQRFRQGSDDWCRRRSSGNAKFHDFCNAVCQCIFPVFV